MSLSDLSTITGIDRGLLSNLESGSRKPSFEQVQVIAEALDLSKDILLADAGLLPPDVRGALGTVASIVTAAARQSIEVATEFRTAPDEQTARLLSKSVERQAKAVRQPLEGDLRGSKSSSIYRAHSYHTKVPPETITPFIEHFTNPGDVILDPFCGSGMTGVAALITNRHAILSDLAPAAVHIARNYTSACPPEELKSALRDLKERMRPTISWLYDIASPDMPRERTEYVTWSDIFECLHCQSEWVYWNTARGEDGQIIGKEFPCPSCKNLIKKTQCKWLGEVPVEVNISVSGKKNRVVRPPNSADLSLIEQAADKQIPYWLPSAPFGEWREMWRAAHREMGIHSVADFYSRRNLLALASLKHTINMVEDLRLRDALLFAFTAIANRASRRYQWNAKRPTNVMAGTLYVSSLRYEWNVWSLFERKARAIIRFYERFPQSESTVECLVGDATDLRHIPDNSIDFVYMDPPFGSNIFYADVSLLWDAWLGQETDTSAEIVVNKHLGNRKGGKSLVDYQSLMTKAFEEVGRVLKPASHAVLVFSNSSDKVWESILAAIEDAGMQIDVTSILDKGQRSIKGVQADLNNQRVTRVDLILTLSRSEINMPKRSSLTLTDLDRRIRRVFLSEDSIALATDYIYSRVLEGLILDDVSVAGVGLSAIEGVCLEICHGTEGGRWILIPAPDYIDVESPYGCIANEYVGDPSILFGRQNKPVRDVQEPLTEAVPGSRSSAFYNAHSYMTKVPPEAIIPFIEHYTDPGDVILDMFAGSGMTGVAAALSGRRSVLKDISVIASHLSFNHTRPCDPDVLNRVWRNLYEELRPLFGQMYGVPKGEESVGGYAHYTLWSERYACPECDQHFTLFDAIDTTSGRVGATIVCPSCSGVLKRQRLRAIGSEPVLINYQPRGGGRRENRKPTENDLAHIASFSREKIKNWFPSVSIGPERDMFNISALHLRGITEVADFYTPRNLNALSQLFAAIQSIENKRIRQVLRFAFTNTAWHGTRMRRFNARGGQRPLTGTLYIPQISSEVNVLEVMNNKIRQLTRYYTTFPQSLEIEPPIITLGSATNLFGIPDNSVDYVFTDPPFGSNIFYADCNLITESWLGGITKVENEAAINRTLSSENGGKTLDHYTSILASALGEAYRVLKPGGWITLVFHNTDAGVWGAIQGAAHSAGFDLVGAGSLDRKQMSHKGYKGRSGTEKVAHFDVVLSLQKKLSRTPRLQRQAAPVEYIRAQVKKLNSEAPGNGRVQWVHSRIIQSLVSDGYDLNSVNFATVSDLISEL